ncbi:sterile alpha motif domain-containing protein 3-like [Salarias fasciatus]|uniref:sterile alpha motif domain-containing protein 3-like n=1 Tax=Salarias fasciatus TaxID=181472 RepID=UPI0011766C96|nr:sterile alpha motif domain-containing protein 3-like [Salarias fasciatus]XP_029959723.1 sterile alpha motif domain-containing protein 3-like [Salarias fasciatus]
MSTLLLRVIVSPQEIRRVTLQTIPPSVDELRTTLRNMLGLRGNFILQFEDPDFGNELCNLTDMKDLPTERATLKVLFTEPVSDSTLDTASLSSLTSSIGSPSSGDSPEWPDPFVIPDFSHDVELQLRRANDAYASNGTVMTISKSVKSEILDRLADTISKITAYPSKDHYESVAKALVSKHPCLSEPGSGKGWFCWVFSLRFKMGNYRQRMMAAGCPEVVVNKRKRGEGRSKPIKKSKKGEIHYLPEPPEGQTTVKSEKDRETMLLEVQKRDPDLQLLGELMTATFSQRRQEIIGDEPLISAVMDRWPALFSQRQISAEFSRIVTKDLLESFLDGLDALVPSLLELYKAAAASGRRVTLSSVLNCLQKEDTNQNRRTATLLGLPRYLSEDSSDIIRMCDVHGETLDVIMKGMQLGLLIGHEGPLQDEFPLEVFSVVLVVEEKIILHGISDVSTGFAMLMGAIYCLNLEYPRKMRYSFEFVQRVMMKIQPDQCSARIHGLRNKLLRYLL